MPTPLRLTDAQSIMIIRRLRSGSASTQPTPRRHQSALTLRATKVTPSRASGPIRILLRCFGENIVRGIGRPRTCLLELAMLAAKLSQPPSIHQTSVRHEDEQILQLRESFRG
jgi:hypothetical protein